MVFEPALYLTGSFITDVNSTSLTYIPLDLCDSHDYITFTTF